MNALETIKDLTDALDNGRFMEEIGESACNARPALKLLVEIVEAAREFVRTETDLMRTQTHAKARLDALLAKLEEQDE